MFTVYVEDHVTHQKVVVGDMLSRAEASELVRTISDFLPAPSMRCRARM